MHAHHPHDISSARIGCLLTLGLVAVAGCGAPSEAPAIRLIDEFETATVAGNVTPPEVEPIEWRFDGEGTIPLPDPPDDDDGDAAEDLSDTFGWSVFDGIDGLEVRDGRLVGTTAELGVLRGRRPEQIDQNDMLHAVEIRMRVSDGTQVGVSFNNAENPDAERVLRGIRTAIEPPLHADLTPGDEFQTYTLENIGRSFRIATMRNILIRPSDVAGAEFEIESIRLIPRREYLLSLESGPGWHGLGEVYRETIISRAPEIVELDLTLPGRPWLDLAVGTVQDGPLTFRVGVGRGGSAETVWQRTVTTPRRWEPVRIDLNEFAGEQVTLSLSLESDNDGTIGFWGTPVVRNSGAFPLRVPSTDARAALPDGGDRLPQGVIFVLMDTLRRDHLDSWGYERSTAPFLATMASEGTRFADNISQGTWTKISVPAILSSLYPTAHGMVGSPDRLSSAATTLTEVYQDAGYATFHTSSIPFTGRLSNLHQGVEVMHELASIDFEPLGHNSAKTARTYVDRFLSWVELHHDVPFFAFVHVFDPHTPFEPYAPYDTMWASPTGKEDHEARLEQVKEFFGDDLREGIGLHRSPDTLPDTVELQQAGVDVDEFIKHQTAWYDGSIRGMDVEIGRLFEGLEQLGLDNTLVVFMSDHGEELLDHGKHFHGNTIYGEMLNVPLFFRWPGVIPAGLVVDETVESINVMPTLLELSGLPQPEQVQGQSLVPLMASPESAAELGWMARPAFSERKSFPTKAEREADDIDQYSVVTDGWKLVQNIDPPDGYSEYELYDHLEDPLNHDDVAAEHPEVVERLSQALAERLRWVEARKLPTDEDATEGMSPAELQRLRSLGYIR